MREPGEDSIEDYRQVAIGEPVPAPTLGTDLCGCPKPPGCWGAYGFHHRPDPQHPDSRAAAQVYERCSTYGATVERSGGYEKPRRKKRTGGRR